VAARGGVGVAGIHCTATDVPKQLHEATLVCVIEQCMLQAPICAVVHDDDAGGVGGAGPPVGGDCVGGAVTMTVAPLPCASVSTFPLESVTGNSSIVPTVLPAEFVATLPDASVTGAITAVSVLPLASVAGVPPAFVTGYCKHIAPGGAGGGHGTAVAPCGVGDGVAGVGDGPLLGVGGEPAAEHAANVDEPVHEHDITLAMPPQLVAHVVN